MSRNIWSDGCPLTLLLCLENTCLSPGILQIGPTSEKLFLYSAPKQTVPTSQRPPLPLRSPPLPLLLSKTKKAPEKKKKKKLFSTLHSPPYITSLLEALHTSTYTSTSTIENTPPPPPLLPEPCISATATRKKVRHVACSVTYVPYNTCEKAASASTGAMDYLV